MVPSKHGLSLVLAKASGWELITFDVDGDSLGLARSLSLDNPLKPFFYDSSGSGSTPVEFMDYPEATLGSFASITMHPSFASNSFEELRYLHLTSDPGVSSPHLSPLNSP